MTRPMTPHLIRIRHWSMISRHNNETRLSSKRQIDANERTSIEIKKDKGKSKLSLRASSGIVRVIVGCSIAVLMVVSLSKNVTLLSSTQPTSLSALLQLPEFSKNVTVLSSAEPTSLSKSFPQQSHQPAKLRFDWTNMPVTTDLAKRILATQTNCSTPLARSRLNQFGLGSSLHSYTSNLCLAFETRRTWTQLSTSEGPWVWRDSSLCNNEDQSLLQCYFPGAELQCPDDPANVSILVGKVQYDICRRLSKEHSTKVLQAATTEYLFRNVSKVVINEAERQLSLVFPSGKVPPGLIVVHIRWGDKGYEMKKVPISEYLAGIQTILQQRGVRDHEKETVDIYLATEDQNAVREFKAAVPLNWNVYVDRYFEEMLPYRSLGDEKTWQTNNANAERTKGKSGLIALASLLVAMEANDFVLTTKSNWSVIMNELRENVVEPRCQGCTLLVDLRPGFQ